MKKTLLYLILVLLALSMMLPFIIMFFISLSGEENIFMNYKNINFCKQYNRVIISNEFVQNDQEKVNIMIDHIGEYEINDKLILDVRPFSEEDYKKSKNMLDLSEAPQAYKDIEEVIAAESDLAEVQVRLTPLAVVKG